MNLKHGYIFTCMNLILFHQRGVPAQAEKLLSTTSWQQKNETQKSVEITLNLINEGDEKIPILKDRRDIILLIGNTGVGKTTIAKLLTMELSDMESYDDVSRLGHLIRDTAKKIGSDSSVISKTTFPELFIDSKTNKAFYDTPGFSDTRNASIELANSFFIKKVADHARRIKFVLIVNHSSVRSGEDRNAFLNAVKHATILIKDTTTYANATCLIANKVDYKFPIGTVVRGIAAFLNQSFTDIPKVIENERQQLNARNFIEALLTKNGDVFSRIGVLYVPDAPGPLDKVSSIQNCIPQLRAMIHNNARFVSSSPDDFLIPVSAETKLLSRNLIELISTRIVDDTTMLTEAIHTHFNNKQIKNGNNNPCEDLSQLLQEFDTLSNITTSMNKATDSKQLLQVLSGNIPKLQLDKTEKERFINRTKRNMNNLNFFVNVSTTGELHVSNAGWFYSQKWALPLQISQNYLAENIQKTGSDFDDSVKVWARSVAELFDKEVQLRVTSYDAKDLSKLQGELGKELPNLQRIKQLVYTWKVQSPKQFVVETLKILNDSIVGAQILTYLATNNDTFCDVDSPKVTTTMKPLSWVTPTDKNLQTVNKLLNNVTLELGGYINSLEQNALAQNKTIDILQEQTASKSDEIKIQSIKNDNLTSLVQEYKDNIYRLKEDYAKNISNLNIELLTLNTNSRNLEQNCSWKITHLEEQCESQKEIWATKERAVAALLQQEKENNQGLLKEKDENLARAIDSHADKIRQIEEDKSKLWTTLRNSESTCTSDKAALEAKRNAIDTQLTNCTSANFFLQQKQTDTNSQLSNCNSEKSDIEETQTTATINLTHCNSAKSEIEHKLADVNLQLTHCNTDKFELGSTKNTVNTQLINCNYAKLALEGEKNVLNSQMSNCNTGISVLEEKLKTVDKELAHSSTSNSVLEHKQHATEKLLEICNSAKSLLEQKQRDADTHLENCNSGKSTLEKEIRDVGRQLTQCGLDKLAIESKPSSQVFIPFFS